MPPKRESKKVDKVDKVESGITLDNILNPVNNDTNETTKTKKIALKKKATTPKIKAVEHDNSIINTSNPKTEKAKPIRGMKKVKKGDDLTYLRLPEKNTTIDFYNLENNEKEIIKNNKVQTIKSRIAKIHQILWESQQMDGEISLSEVMNLMFLKYLGVFASETTKNNKIDLLNRKYYIDKIDSSTLDKCLPYIKDFSLIYKEMVDIHKITGNKDKWTDYRSGNNDMDIIKQITEILKIHPTTSKIFDTSVNDILKIKNYETLFEVLKVLNEDCFSPENQIEDLVGEIYEYFVNDYMKSKSALGQYFTPRTLMAITLKLKRKEIEATIAKFKDVPELIASDKTMGTGGWLVKFYNDFKDLHNNILLHGCEVKENTYKYGLINILTTSGKFPKEPVCGNTLTVVPKQKVHFGTSNPPFSAGLKYATLKIEYENNSKRFREMEKKGDNTYKDYNLTKFEDIYFLKDEDSTPLQVLQLYIHSLEEGGLCFIVIPYGELFYKDGIALNKVRELLLNKINITDIIVCPGGLFTYTDTKVCMVIFEKNSKGTKEIKFGRYDFNTQEHKDKKRFLKFYRHYSTVKKEDILKEPIKSLYHMDYLHDEHSQELQDSGKVKDCEWVEFGDVFDLIKGQIASGEVEEVDDEDDSKEVFINLSNKEIYKKINNSLHNDEAIFISNTSPIGLIQYYNGKYSYSNLLDKCLLKNNFKNKINLKYMYYYLKSLKCIIENYYSRGSCNQSLDIKNFLRMKIPIPSMDMQQAYVKTISNEVGRQLQIDTIDHKLSNLSYIETLANTIKTKDVKELFELALKNQIKMPETQWVEFGEVFDLVKGTLQSSKVEEDEDGDGIPIISIATIDKIMIENKKFDLLDGENIFISTVPAGNWTSRIKYYNGKCHYTNLMSKCKINNSFNNKINIKYMYYYLKSINDYIDNIFIKGSCNPSIDIKNFMRMKIPIPPIETQNNIVDEINEVESMTQRWKRDIDYLKNKKGNRMLDIINFGNLQPQ
jgi:type I restriction enzyme S subunit